ncbi:pyridoxamine 5'-phosphate oxidase family protein [Actinomycetospora atypica]|uniref:Pyridoxamine 5'-phosphate oxidase family protein n=1 Tax=Actinomycetospora atypica TaxID=1290095 RepID=A0ABV9YQJ1_9PSEU
MNGGLGRVEDRSGETTGEIDLSRLPGPRAADDDEAGPPRGVTGEAPPDEARPEPDPDPQDAWTDDDAGPDDWDEEPFPDGPLHGDVLHRVVAAGTAVLATSDLHGRRDISVLSGPRCFLRVLDATRLAFPDEGEESTTAVRANLAEVAGLGMLLVDHDGRRGLHLDGTARVVPAAELRAEHPDLPESPVPGRPTDVWVVVEVGDLYPLDGDDVPRFGAGRPAAAPPPERGRSRGTLAALAVLGVLVLLLGALSIVLATSGGQQEVGAQSPAPAPAPAADAAPTGPPVLRGQVRQVLDPATVVVDVDGRPVTVAVVGLDAATIPACATPAALAFARETLDGQTVTLVPDPTLPPSPSGPTRAYAVLGSQLSYTDAAILGGHAKASGAAQYRAVFDREQGVAQDDGVGMWGPPCVS